MAGTSRKTKSISLRVPNALHDDLSKISRIHFNGSISTAIIAACRKLIEEERARQARILDSKYY